MTKSLRSWHGRICIGKVEQREERRAAALNASAPVTFPSTEGRVREPSSKLVPNSGCGPRSCAGRRNSVGEAARLYVDMVDVVAPWSRCDPALGPSVCGRRSKHRPTPSGARRFGTPGRGLIPFRAERPTSRAGLSRIGENENPEMKMRENVERLRMRH